MPVFDLPIAELRAYSPPLPEPDDLEEFWSDTISAARALRTPTRAERVHTGLRLVESWDLEFSGFGGHPVRAWLQLPAIQRPASGFGVVVEYVGAGGGRGLPHEPSLWAMAGLAHVIMDNRGQGSAWRVGDTADPVDGVGGAPAFPGFTTRGIVDHHAYYYRRLFTDAVLAIDVVRDRTELDGNRIVVDGTSQGGGVAIATASLADGLLGLLAEVPYLADFRRGAAIAGPPYSEIAGYLAIHRDQVDLAFDTLAYFDVAILGRRARVPALFAAALMDATTPPSTVFAAYNNYGGPKEIVVYEFNGHEGGGSHFSRRKLDFVEALFASSGPNSAESHLNLR